MQVVLELQELESLKDKLKDFNTNIQIKEPLLRELGNYLYNSARDSFEKEQDWNGKVWSPLSSTTYLLKQKKGKPDKKLFFDGSLQDKFITQYTSNSVSVGTNATTKDGFLYPTVMQFGTKNAGRNKKVTIPDRPFLPINLDGSLYKGVENELMEITVEFIDIVLKKADL